MQDRALYSIHEARKLLGGSRNTLYHRLRAGQRTRIGSRRFIAAAAFGCPIARTTTNISPSVRW